MATSVTPATLFLIPVPVVEGAFHTLSPEVATCTSRLQFYFAENARTARRALRAMHPKLPLEPIQISEMDKHTGPDLALFRQWVTAGHEIGVMSEAGCPGIADPGAEVVAAAHALGVQVVPLVGPSAILLALMASGLNGQSFSFQGYVPVKDPQRMQRIKELEARSAKERQAQIFIETPYRNGALFADFLRHCLPTSRICVALNVTAPDAFIATKTVAEWQKATPAFAKVPGVFILQAS